jgi:hypothetical protein
LGIPSFKGLRLLTKFEGNEEKMVSFIKEKRRLK